MSTRRLFGMALGLACPYLTPGRQTALKLERLNRGRGRRQAGWGGTCAILVGKRRGVEGKRIEEGIPLHRYHVRHPLDKNRLQIRTTHLGVVSVWAVSQDENELKTALENSFDILFALYFNNEVSTTQFNHILEVMLCLARSA
jgi:hypothetical protein